MSRRIGPYFGESRINSRNNNQNIIINPNNLISNPILINHINVINYNRISSLNNLNNINMINNNSYDIHENQNSIYSQGESFQHGNFLGIDSLQNNPNREISN